MVARAPRAPAARGAERANALVDALASLYAYVYDVTEEAVHRAAQQRALAMDISDGWIERGCDPASPLIATTRGARALLRRAAVGRASRLTAVGAAACRDTVPALS